MYFLIGGGEVGNLETFRIDAAIVEYSNKRNPNVLYVPMASHDSEGYIQVVKSIYEGILESKYDYLSLSEHPDREKIESKIEKADIIYVGGGDTKYLIDKWKEYGLYEIRACKYFCITSSIHSGTPLP